MQDSMDTEREASQIVTPGVQQDVKKPLSMRVVYIVVFLGMVIGSFTTPLTKIVINMGLSGECITFYRMFIVVLCLMPVCFSSKQYRDEMKLAFSDKRTSLLLIVLGICKLLGILFAAFGIRYVPILVYNTIWNLNPVFVIILAYFILHERVNSKALTGVGICVLGVLIVGGEAIVTSLISGESKGIIWGIIIAIISAFSYALYMIVNRLLRSGFSLPTLMFVLFSIAAVMDFTICLIKGTSLYLPWNAMLLIIVLALFCTLLSQSLPVWAMKYMSPSLYSLINLLGIILTAINAYLLLHEIPTIFTVAGAALLILGLFLYTKAKQQRAH